MLSLLRFGYTYFIATKDELSTRPATSSFGGGVSKNTLIWRRNHNRVAYKLRRRQVSLNISQIPFA